MVSVDLLLQEAIRTAAQNRHDEAAAMFRRVVELQPRNEAAWVWLSELAGSDEERIVCLERVLAISPQNRAARERLGALKEVAAEVELAVADTESLGAEEDAIEPVEPAGQEAVRSCWKCGADNPAENDFCGRCGATSTLLPQAEERPQPKAEETRKGTGCAWRWLLVGSAGVALSLLVLFVVAWASGLVEVGGLTWPPTLPSSAETPAADSSDDPYLVCSQGLMIEWADLTGDASQGATALAREGDFRGFCADQARWEGRAQRLQEKHSRCRTPTDVNLRAARQYVENGLGEMEAGIGFFGAFCDELMNFGPDWGAIQTGDARMQASNQWAERASREMENYSP